MTMEVLSVNVARAAPLVVGGRSVMSAIGKRAVDGRVAVGRMGLAGDEQADPTLHGGPGKAVYAYPFEHYAFWRTVRLQARTRLGELARWDDLEAELPHGLLGENLTIRGLAEMQVWVGDRLRGPDCELAVSEPRFPCARFGAAMGFDQAPKLMRRSGWCGFYLAVIEPGSVGAGDRFTLVEGPREVGIVELFRARTGVAT